MKGLKSDFIHVAWQSSSPNIVILVLYFMVNINSWMVVWLKWGHKGQEWLGIESLFDLTGDVIKLSSVCMVNAVFYYFYLFLSPLYQSGRVYWNCSVCLSIFLCVWALFRRYVLNCSAFWCIIVRWSVVQKKKNGLLSSKSQRMFTQSYRWKYVCIHMEIHQIKMCIQRSVFWQFLELKKKSHFTIQSNPYSRPIADPCFLKFLITNNQT